MNERKALIARLRDATEGPRMLMGEAADMLEADAQSIDVAYSQGFIEGERAAIVSQAVPQDPVAILNHAHGLHAIRSVNLAGLPDGEYKLYTAQQRPRLTDAEIKTIEHETDMKSSIGDWSNYFARAIEAKVRGEE